MNFKELVLQRYSVRSYLPKEVEEEKILQILDAGRNAPSCVNYQPWHFLVVREPENHKKASELYRLDWFNNAPVYIFIFGDHQKSWVRKEDGKDHCDIDIAIAVDHMTLQATELGLGTCWICNFHVEKCKEFFNLPEHIEPMAILTLGYPSEQKTPEKKRKSLEEVTHWEKF